MRRPLSPEEFDTLALIASGHTDREIAQRLGYAHETVKSRTRRILAKLDAHNRAHAVAVAYRIGLLPVPADRRTA